jgi:drug/metabolite transporter (DMT)-like permease
MPEFKDYLHLHFLVLIWGFTAILGLLISVPSVELVFFRTLFASVGLAAILYFYKLPFRIGQNGITTLLLTGVLIAGHWILFFGSARVSNASVCLAGLATTSFWTSLLEPLVLQKRVKWYEVFLGLLVILGLYIIFHFEFNHALGLAMGIGSAFLAALFTVLNARYIKRYNHYQITFYEILGAFLSILLFLPIYQYTMTESDHLQLSLTLMDLLYISILAFICTVYAYSASIDIMKRISAFSVNLIVNLEPVYGIVLAVLIFGENEKMHPGFYLGSSVIILAVLAHPVLNKRYRNKYLEAESLH